MKERALYNRTKFSIKTRPFQNVFLPPNLITGEYGGFNGGIVFPPEEGEMAGKLPVYPISDGIINEKPPKNPESWLPQLAPLMGAASTAYRQYGKYDKKLKKEENRQAKHKQNATNKNWAAARRAAAFVPGGATMVNVARTLYDNSSIFLADSRRRRRQARQARFKPRRWAP